MDLYHQMLLKLDEAAGANPQKTIDLAAIIKRDGFGGALDDIFDFFSREGWMVEAGAKGSARITQWGIDEARRTRDASSDGASDGSGANAETARAAHRAAEAARELSELLEAYAASLTQSPQTARKQRRAVLAKLKELNKAIEADD